MPSASRPAPAANAAETSASGASAPARAEAAAGEGGQAPAVGAGEGGGEAAGAGEVATAFRADQGEPAAPTAGERGGLGAPFFRRPGAGVGAPTPGPDGGPSSAPETPADAWASAAAGSGAARHPGGPCPADMVLAGAACVDRHEAFLARVDEAGGEAPWPYYQRPRAGVAYAARNAAGASPQAYINRSEAEAACRLAGKRLCALSEWQRACQGKRQTLFPYGRSYQKGACNSGKPHLLSMFFGRDGHAWKYEEHFNSPLLDQQPGYLAKAGEYGACASDEGARDLVGNLHEWVADLVDRMPFDPGVAPGAPPRRRPLTRPGNGIFLGGFFSTTDEHGAGCTFITTAHEPAYHDYSVGFRCCRDPGPR